MNNSILMSMDEACEEEKEAMVAKKKGAPKMAEKPTPTEACGGDPVKEQPKLEQNPGHTWRKKTARSLINDAKLASANPLVCQMLDFALMRFDQTCDAVAMHVADVPRGMGIKNNALRDVFEEIAEAVKYIPDGLDAAAGKAAEAKRDAADLPDLSAETKRIGFEQGYKEGVSGAQSTLGDFDIDID